MAFLTPTNKRIIGTIAAAASGLVLLMGKVPVLEVSTSTMIAGMFTFGQVLGVVNLVLAYMLYKNEIR